MPSAVKNTPANGNGPGVGDATATGRAMPVAVEISVTATGAKPPEGNSERQLFTEETSTVLVLPDGAVIRLAAAVTQSQLIFLTNNATKREVVCQVLRKRSYRPTSCYVELQFTETAADFWGVDFLMEETVSAAGAAGPGLVGSGTAGSEAEEEVAAAEAIVEEPAVAVTAPSDKEVLQLREEVDALRSQLQSLLVKKEEPAVVVPTAPIAPVAPAAPVTPKIDISQAVQIARDLAAGSEMKAKAEKKEIGEAGAESEEDAMQHLLPEVELDFSKVPAKVQEDGLAGPNGKAPLVGTGKFLRVGGLMVVLAGILFGAWYENWLPILKRSAEPVAAANGGEVVTRPAKAATGNTTNGNAAGSTSEAKDAKNEAPSENSADVAKGLTVESAENNPAPARKDSGEKDAAGKGSKKRAEKVEAPTAEVAADAGADSAVITPAKLVQPVNPVYPPDAMRNYITGDVKLDAVVEADGRMGAMNVLSGPAPLRAAAMEALKQYKYSPAMQNGKGVASHVKVTIKFWFDP